MNSLEQQDIKPQEQKPNQPSAEYQRELNIAKNDLKITLDGISREKLIALNDPIVSHLIIGCDGDVDKYVHDKMEGNAGNAPDIAALHVTQNLIRIKKCLENNE